MSTTLEGMGTAQLFYIQAMGAKAFATEAAKEARAVAVEQGHGDPDAVQAAAYKERLSYAKRLVKENR